MKGTFQDDGIKLEELIEMCRRPNNNIYTTTGNHCQLEIDYTFDYKRYRIWFDSNDERVRFPLYRESELRKRIFLPTILSALLTKEPDSESGIDVTREINEAAGPLGNFYDDVKHKVKKDDVLREHTNNDLYLCLIAYNGKSYTFDKHDKYLTLQKEPN